MGCADPSAIILSNDRTRVYYGGLGSTRVVTLSAISGLGVGELKNNSNSIFKIYPNPTKTETRIWISDIALKEVRLKIFDVSGKLVRNFPNYQFTNHPITQITWDGKDNLGKGVESGVYFCQIVAAHFSETKKINPNLTIMTLMGMCSFRLNKSLFLGYFGYPTVIM
ncbi:MAG: T9SS type A sorting domain-containing protein [bacterium]|nr:T9SS type A sorting domain-containing protein [bacterium]